MCKDEAPFDGSLLPAYAQGAHYAFPGSGHAIVESRL